MGFLTKKKTITDIYLDLRKRALALQPGEIGLKPDPANPVFGVLMETGYKDAAATLLAVGDGTVSLYFSNGGGIIGLGEYKGPRKACISLLSLANQFAPLLQPATEFSLPAKGRVIFYFLTTSGVLTTNVKENDLGRNKHALSPLFHKAQEVITQARQIDEKRQRELHDLMHAATTGKTDKLKLLIAGGMDPNTVDSTGLTALMAASYSGQLKALELLLEAGVSLDAQDASGFTALMFACNRGQLSCAHCLIENGASVHAVDNDDSTPIMFCAQHGYDELVRLLLEKGADPAVKGKHGLSAIDLAKQNKRIETEGILQGRV
jgi:hypothetical protein